MSVARNISIVPKLLGWDAARTSERVDELLDLVGLDPARYRDRYPRELSGGQQQRVGVARGLAADPPVILMDEPFGAVDPITRQRLQDELLSIQRELRKTIVCVTHDIDEAIKLGDRIVILREGAEIAQYDTPENILAAPADDFVERLRGLRLHAQAAVAGPGLGDRPRGAAHRHAWGSGWRSVVARAERAGHDSVVVLDDRGRPPGLALAAPAARRDRRRPSTTSSSTRWTPAPPSTTPSTPCSPRATAAPSSPGTATSTSASSASPPSPTTSGCSRSRRGPRSDPRPPSPTDGAQAGTTAAVADAAARRRRRPASRRRRRPPGAGCAACPRETVLMLVLPPVLVTLVFLGYVWWRADGRPRLRRAVQLAWPTVGTLIWEHVKLTFVSAVLVVAGRRPARHRADPRPACARAAPLVVGIANAGQAAPAIGLIVLLAMWLGLRLLDRRARAGAVRRAAGAAQHDHGPPGRGPHAGRGRPRGRHVRARRAAAHRAAARRAR